MNTVVPAGLLALVLGSGCASGPTEHTLYFQGVEELNRNSSGQSTPVNVRVYQLTDRQRFEEAGFEALWSVEPEVLGDTLIEARETVITTTPEEVPFPLTTPERVRFIGIVGLFNEEDGPWKTCVAVDDVEDWLFKFRAYQILKEER